MLFFYISKFPNGHNFDFDVYHGVWQMLLKDWLQSLMFIFLNNLSWM
jgi:hypothetical protein